MGEKIDIDDEVWTLLRSKAEPFIDTPNSVLRRLLGLDPGGMTGKPAKGEAPRASTSERTATQRRKSGGPKKGKQKMSRTRAPAGSLLSEDRYELPLLRALDKAGGRAPYREVVEAVGIELKDEFKPLDLETLNSGAIRWQSRLQFVRLRLIERGLLDRDTPRGVWGITELGRQALESGVTK